MKAAWYIEYISSYQLPAEDDNPTWAYDSFSSGGIKTLREAIRVLRNCLKDRDYSPNYAYRFRQVRFNGLTGRRLISRSVIHQKIIPAESLPIFKGTRIKDARTGKSI